MRGFRLDQDLSWAAVWLGLWTWLRLGLRLTGGPWVGLEGLSNTRA